PPPEEAPKLVEQVKKEEAPETTKAEEAAGPETKKEILEEPKAETTTTGTGEQQGEVKACVDHAAAEGSGEADNQNQNQIMDNNKMMGSGMEDHENMKRMMYRYYQYQPLYIIERIPPPQLFSDENPNACCIL
ncbi:heavy metal-associated isoprenylated plant protein 9, partial [Momordica charantia]|uniref:Heavy metal-associated isoprenylated plant protein 9 n=1 Tax=Momordica charantia TaxID=3673 RepID=A0A6J1CHR0_MOMCH